MSASDHRPSRHDASQFHVVYGKFLGYRLPANLWLTLLPYRLWVSLIQPLQPACALNVFTFTAFRSADSLQSFPSASSASWALIALLQVIFLTGTGHIPLKPVCPSYSYTVSALAFIRMQDFWPKSMRRMSFGPLTAKLEL